MRSRCATHTGATESTCVASFRITAQRLVPLRAARTLVPEHCTYRSVLTLCYFVAWRLISIRIFRSSHRARLQEAAGKKKGILRQLLTKCGLWRSGSCGKGVLAVAAGSNRVYYVECICAFDIIVQPGPIRHHQYVICALLPAHRPLCCKDGFLSLARQIS